MAEINKTVCYDGKSNFAKSGCGDNPGKLRYAYLVYKNTDLLTTVQLATPESALQTKMTSAVRKDRAYLIGELCMPENNGEGVAYETREQFKIRTDKGTWDYIFTLKEGTWCDHQSVLSFDGKQGIYDIVLVDENNKLWCMQSATGIKGFRLHAFEVLPWEQAVSGTGVKYRVRIAMSNIDQINKEAVFVQLDFNPFETLQGVEDVSLTNITPGGASAGVIHVALKGACGETNLAELYSDTSELRQPGAFTVKRGNGDDITITSVALDVQNNEIRGFKLTLDTSDPHYSATQKAYVNLAGISAIYGYLGTYMEGTALEITLS
jgi:hypothetical protein